MYGHKLSGTIRVVAGSDHGPLVLASKPSMPPKVADADLDAALAELEAELASAFPKPGTGPAAATPPTNHRSGTDGAVSGDGGGQAGPSREPKPKQRRRAAANAEFEKALALIAETEAELSVLPPPTLSARSVPAAPQIASVAARQIVPSGDLPPWPEPCAADPDELWHWVAEQYRRAHVDYRLKMPPARHWQIPKTEGNTEAVAVWVSQLAKSCIPAKEYIYWLLYANKYTGNRQLSSSMSYVTSVTLLRKNIGMFRRWYAEYSANNLETTVTNVETEQMWRIREHTALHQNRRFVGAPLWYGTMRELEAGKHPLANWPNPDGSRVDISAQYTK